MSNVFRSRRAWASVLAGSVALPLLTAVSAAAAPDPLPPPPPPAVTPANAGTPVKVTYVFSDGYQYFTVPPGVHDLHLAVAGGAGGDAAGCDELSTGGHAASVSGDVHLSPGEVLPIFVGEGGHRDGRGGIGGPRGRRTGGQGGRHDGPVSTVGGGGGAASFVWRGGANDATVLLAAPGGGGGGGRGGAAWECGGGGGDGAGDVGFRGIKGGDDGYPEGDRPFVDDADNFPSRGGTPGEGVRNDGGPGGNAVPDDFGGGGGGGGAGFAGAGGGGDGGEHFRGGGGGAGGNAYHAAIVTNVSSVPYGSHGDTGRVTIMYTKPLAATTTVVRDGFTMVGNPATLQATVSAGATGTVAFSVDGTPFPGCGAQRLLTGADPANTAYCATSDLPAGDHTVTAVYSGDADHATSTGTAAQRILKYASTTTLTASEASGRSFDVVTFDADVAPVAGGVVSFDVDGSPAFGCQPAGTVSAGGGKYRASCTTLGIPAGVHTVTATWSGTDRYAASSGSVTYTVTPTLGTPRLTVGSVSTAEGTTGTHLLVFTVRLSEADTVPITVAYRTSDGTAHAGSDYVAASGRLTIPAGSVYRRVGVPIRGDLTKEASERFLLTLSAPQGAVIETGTATGTVVNDD